MAYDIGIKLKLDGEKDYRDAINKITQVNKTLDAELKAVTSSFDKNTTAEEKKRKTEEILQKQLENSREKLAKVGIGLKDATANYDENSKEVLSWRQAYAKAETEVNNITQKLNSLDDALEDTTENSSDFKTIFTANLSAEAVKGAITGIVNGIKQIGEALVNTAKESRQFADDIRTMSTQMNISTDTMQEFWYMQDLVDVSAQSLADGFRKVTVAMKSAENGSGDAYDTFNKLGVAIYDSEGKLRSSSDVFLDVIDALGQISNETERNIAATTLLGETATNFNTIIAIGSEGMRQFRNEAHETGYVLDEERINSLVGVSDQFARMDLAMTTAKNTIGVALAPVIIALANAIIALINQVRVIVANIQEFANQCVNLYNIVSTAIASIPGIFQQMGSTIATTFSNLISSAFSWGSDMISGFASGITSHMNAVLERVRGLASSIRSFLHFSRPDIGPLRDYETWMPDFMKGLAKGIDMNSYLVENAIGRVADGMTINPNISTTSARGGIMINLGGVTFNGYTSKQGNDLVKDLNRQLGRLY